MNAQAPCNPMAEKSVLAACLRYNAFPEVSGIVDPEDFHDGAHQVIFQSMRILDLARKDISPATVFETLIEKGWTKDVRQEYLVELWDEWRGHDFKDQATIVRTKAVSRELLRACADIAREVYSPTMAEADNLDYAEKLIFELGQRRSRNTTNITVPQATNEGADRVDASVASYRGGEISVPGVPSGFSELENIVNGWRPGELTIIGARTSVGKTAFAINLFRNAFVAGYPGLFFSLEMATAELADRLICLESQIDSHAMRRGTLTDAELVRISQTREKYQDVESWLNDDPRLTAHQIFSIGRRQRNKDRLALIFVDYLQLIQPENRREQRYIQIGESTRMLKAMAKELNLPVLVMAQLSRDADDHREPQLSHLRESGNIEQDADNVIFLHNPKKEQMVEVIVAKQRSGRTGSLQLWFEPKYSQFANASL